MEKRKIHRVQVDFTEDGYRQLEELATQASEDPQKKLTKSRLIRDALGHYEWFIQQKNRGVEILSRTPNGEVEKIVFI